MSNTNGYATLTKSMNGIITLSDGAGTTISNGTIEATNLEVDNLDTQNLDAPDRTMLSKVYARNTGDVVVGSFSDYLYLRNLYTTTQGGIQLLETTDPAIPFAFLTNNTNDIYLGSNTTPLISDYVCTASNHLANKQYVDSVSGGGVSLSSNNIWTGTNQYENIGINSNVNNKLNIGYNLTSGKTLYLGATGGTGDIYMNSTDLTLNALDQIDLIATNVLGINAPYVGMYSTTQIENKTPKYTIRNPITYESKLDIIPTSGNITQNYCTYATDPTITTSSIVASGGGATTNSGNIAITSTDLTLTALDQLDLIVTNTLGINSPYVGMYSLTQIEAKTPKFAIRNALTYQSKLDIAPTSGNMALNFGTYATDPTITTASIVASGGTAITNSGNITINSTDFSLIALDQVDIIATNTLGINSPNIGMFATTATEAQTPKFTIRNNGTVYSSHQIIPLSTGSITQNFFTFPSSPLVVSSAITATGGTSGTYQGTLTLKCNRINLDASDMVNIDTDKLIITNGTSPSTAITATFGTSSDIFLAGWDGTPVGTGIPPTLPLMSKYPFYNGLPTIQLSTAGNYSLKCTEKQYRALILIGYDAPDGVDVVLDQGNTSMIDGQEYMIWNMSAFPVTIKTNNSATIANLYKVGMSRGGFTFFNLVAGTGCYARAFTGLSNILMIPPSGINRGWIISMIT
jgi:hypothetical protein